jgi:hypothetical protein
VEFYTVIQVADILQVNTATIYDMIKSHALQACIINVDAKSKLPRYRITKDALELFVNSRQTVPAMIAPPPKKKLPPVGNHFPKFGRSGMLGTPKALNVRSIP